MRPAARIARVGCTLWLALAAGGCATVPAPAPGTVSSPIPGHGPEVVHSSGASAGTTTASPAPVTTTPMGTTASGGTISQTGSVAPIDSGPSADAQAVLRTIPDPVPGSEAGQAAVPAGSSGAAGSAGITAGTAGVAGAAPGDSAVALADSSSAGADTSSVPIPALTQPLGDRPGAVHVVTDPATPVGPPSTAQAPPAGGAQGSPVAPDPCWRVQVAAVPEQPRAKALCDAAQSQLMTTMVIETEKKLYKVRTKDCLTTEVADRLKQRAIAAGFTGAFRFKPPK